MSELDWDNLGVKIPIGIKDKDGNEIHLGDYMEFDYVEFWKNDPKKLEMAEKKPVVFQVIMVEGELYKYGSFSDLSEFCKVIENPKQNATTSSKGE